MNNFRQQLFTTKKSTSIKKNNQQKSQFEDYAIHNGINLKILNARVEKAKFDIQGNYIYKIDNKSHYEVNAELDFTGSKNIKSKGINDNLVYNTFIDPFSYQDTIENQEESTENIKGKICELEYAIGYNIHSNFKFEINFPTLEKQKQLIEEDLNFIKDQLILCQENLNNIHYEYLSNEEFTSLINKYKIKTFIDPEFAPTKLLELDINLKEYDQYSNSKNVIEEEFKKICVHWIKIENLLPDDKKILFTLEDINPLEIYFGLVCNINLRCVLTHLSEYPQLIIRLLEKSISDYSEILKINLYTKGAWKEVVVDGYIPCFPKSFPIYSYGLNSGWIMVLEKALAKLLGGYTNLKNIRILTFYSILTGFPTESFSFTNDTMTNGDINNLFNKIEDAKLKGYILSASNKNSTYYNDYESHFIPYYTYPILDVQTVENKKVIIIRNIWKETSFNGEYYRNISKLSPEMLKLFDIYGDKSSLLLTPLEFCLYFNNINIVHTGNYHELTLRSKFTRCQDSIETDLENIISNNYYELKITELTNVKLCIQLSDCEVFKKNFYSKNMDLGIAIISKDKNNKWNLIRHDDMKFDKQILVEVILLPGLYYVVPRTMGYCNRKNKLSYNTTFTPFGLDNKLNLEVLDKIFEDIFYLYDSDCSHDLCFIELSAIMTRLNGVLEQDEFNNIVKKYSINSKSLTLRGFKNFMKDIFLVKNLSQIMEFLRNLGYDHNMYSYLNRFFSIHFYSSKNISINSKLNVYENLDRIVCNLILEEMFENNKDKSGEFTHLSYRSKCGRYYIEGVRNNSKKLKREVYFDARESINLYSSTFMPNYSKVK